MKNRRGEQKEEAEEWVSLCFALCSYTVCLVGRSIKPEAGITVTFYRNFPWCLILGMPWI